MMPASILAVLIAVSGVATIMTLYFWLKNRSLVVGSNVVELSTIVMAAATCTGVAIAAWGVWQLKADLSELLQATISMQLEQQFDSAEMRHARRELARELLKDKTEISETRVLDFFEKVGLYEDLHRVSGSTRPALLNDRCMTAIVAQALGFPASNHRLCRQAGDRQS
jgi:hypothetical protein